MANQQGLFVYVRTCKTRLDTTTKFVVVVTSLFNLIISSFPDNMFYHVWTWLLIYHDGSNNVVQVCSFIKPWTVCSNMHEQACQQHCSSLLTSKNKLCVKVNLHFTSTENTPQTLMGEGQKWIWGRQLLPLHSYCTCL